MSEYNVGDPPTDRGPIIGVPKDDFDALVAEAYEGASKTAFNSVFDTLCQAGGVRVSVVEETCKSVVEAIRTLTPADAIAAREARDRQMKNEALREALQIVKDHHQPLQSRATADAIYNAIEALIEKGPDHE